MASTKLVFLVVAVLLLQASWCAVAQEASQAVVMALTSFEDGEPAACDGKYHSNKDRLVALPPKLFGSGRRCHRKINISITRPDGRHVTLVVPAEVVDECASGCKDNMIATSKRVWDDLRLDTNLGEVPVFVSPSSFVLGFERSE